MRLMKAFSFIILLFITLARPAAAEVVIIVNPENPTSQLNRDQVIDIYMGRYTHFPDSSSAKPIDQAIDSPIRAIFYQKLVNKSVAQINAFWARLLFTGRATPPKALSDGKSVTNTVMNNRDAIGYIDSQYLDDKVKVVFRLP